LCIEEFSADDCDYLQLVLTEIIDFAVEYFRLDDPKINPQVALHEFVPSWMKFKELVIILNSGLQDVYDRWSDGKGPLAMHFTGEEVKKVVIAMFENTSKRSALLKQLTRRPSVHLS
jgi:centromere/kinetochore protein ZW10